MILNIKRFAPDPYWFEVDVRKEYEYTTKNYTASCTVILMGEHDFSSIVDQNNRDVTSEWNIHGNMGSKRITQETHDVLTIHSEDGYYSDNITIDVSDFTPDSDLYAPEINGDIKIKNSNTKMKNVADVVENYFDYIYPIGSVYKSTNAINPQNIFGGTWTQITDDIIVAYGHAAGTTLSQSKNISSVTNLGSSAYQVTFSKTMANADFKAFVSGECSGIGSEIIGVYSQTTSGFRYDFANYSGTATTPTSVNIVVVGKLANPEYYEWRRIG